MTRKKKLIAIILAAAMMTLVIAFFYPRAAETIALIHTNTHIYAQPYIKPNLSVRDISHLPPAEAVPILIYHGVITHGTLGTNIERRNFIEHMEALKKEGYETISIKEYELFLEGEFTLPPKPIIITFDDGRKDSYYTTDAVLKKLGFEATIFVATVKPNENDPFYLNWDELRDLQKSGRWDIEAHGRLSHAEIMIDESGAHGKYLASRIYDAEKGIESISDYKRRVEEDYRNGILDLKENLGVESKYFAIPLNDYGMSFGSNYDSARAYNEELTKRFFRLAFVESGEENYNVFETFYNYRNSDPHKIKRLEPKNMSVKELLYALRLYAPRSPGTIGEVGIAIPSESSILYNVPETATTNVSDSFNPSEVYFFGDRGWRGYALDVYLRKEDGSSVSAVAYYTDADNFIAASWRRDAVVLEEYSNGEKREIASYHPLPAVRDGKVTLVLHEDTITSYFNGVELVQKYPIKLENGAVGLASWGPGAEGGTYSGARRLEIINI